MASARRILNGGFQSRRGHEADRCQKCPLVGIRLESFVYEHAETFFAGFLLERQRNQVAEATLWQGVLIGEQPVIRFEFQLPGAGAGVADNGGTETARIPCRHGGSKENPGMGTGAGAGNFDGNRQAKFATGNGKGLYILAPVSLIKINGEEMAGIVGKQGIDTDNMLPGKMIVNNAISER